jgi:hypothetical protein
LQVTPAKIGLPKRQRSFSFGGGRELVFLPHADLAGAPSDRLGWAWISAVEAVRITSGCHSAWRVRLPRSGLIAHDSPELHDAPHVAPYGCDYYLIHV